MAEDHRLANVLGAFALAVVDGMDAATERAALVALSQFLDGRSILDLGQVVGLTHSGAVRLVDRLVAAGLVERRRGADGRTVSLVLSDEGRRQAGRAREARLSTLDDLLAVLDDQEREALGDILDKLVGTVVSRRLEARAAGVDPPGGWMCRLCDLVACERDEGSCPVARAASSAG
jgi:MarR family transcriptional repressor of emrRAB